MKLKLDRPLVFLDLEATGLHVIKDRIVQIALIKLTPDGGSEERSLLINPGMPIPPDAQAVHGISDEQVADKPSFREVAGELFAFIGEADLAGYNSNRYDIPMLMEEFGRAGLDFQIDRRRLIDAQTIFYKMEPRTLPAALQFYCEETLEDAHDALADVRATLKVLKGQIARYAGRDHTDGEGQPLIEPVRNDMAALHDFCRNPQMLDVTNRLKYDRNGDIVFNFGKYRGKKVVEVFQKEPTYYNWIMKSDFSRQVKQWVTRIIEEHEGTSNK